MHHSFRMFLIAATAAFALNGAGFRAAFDGSLDVDGAVPLKATNISFVAGIRGQAVHVRRDGWLEYAYDPSYVSDEGATIVAWVKTDWTLNGCLCRRDRDLVDGKWEAMFASDIHRTLLRADNIFGAGIGLYFGVRFLDNDMNSILRGRLRAGEWHQLAYVYDAKGGCTRMYFDGRLEKCRMITPNPKKKEGKTLQLGCGGVRGGRFGRKLGAEAAFDDVRLEPRVWTDDEVLADYVKSIPYRIELLDWSVWEGETRRIRFRVRNISDSVMKRRFTFTGGHAVQLSLSPGELKEFSLPVTGAEPGLFRITLNEGETDCRTFELSCLSKDVLAQPSVAGKETLVGEYDCTRDYPSNVFNECGSKIVADSPCGPYRECDVQLPGVGLLYRFGIRSKGKPHRLEIDYPDDAKRDFSFGAWPENYNRLHTGSIDCAGILTGIDVPLTMKMRTKSFVFWPDSDTVAVGILGYKGYDKSNGGRPPAVAAVRLYSMDSLPAAPNTGASKDRRTAGTWDEDPTMDAQLAFSHAVNFVDADLDFWRVKWRRIIDYMRHEGLDTWVIKVLAYQGDVTGMEATLGHPSSDHAFSDGRCPGWAEIGADMLDRAGMDVWARYNHKYSDTRPWIGGANPPKEMYFLDKDGNVPRHYSKGNILHPLVRNEFKSIIRAYRDKFKVYPHFRGVTMNEDPGIDFSDIYTGYDDYTVSAFTRETGTSLPKTPAERFDAIVRDSALLERWIDWRCAKVAEFAQELASVLREDGGGYELQCWIRETRFYPRRFDWFAWDPRKALRLAGIDLDRLNAIDGLRVVPFIGTDHVHYRREFDSDQESFLYRDSFRALMRGAGISSFNVVPVNLEIYPSITQRKNLWKRPFWMPVGGNMVGRPNFYNYATAHVDSKYVLEPFAALVADYDVQDFLHGWWGIPESGDNARFRDFYTQYRALPRGRYDLAPGVNEPVAARVGENGFYLVNREPYPVKVTWRRDGKAESAELGNCEIRWFPVGKCVIADVACEIPEAEWRQIASRIGVLRGFAASHPKERALADVLNRVEKAFSERRYTTVRGLFRTAAARRAFMDAQGVAYVSRRGNPRCVGARRPDEKGNSGDMSSRWQLDEPDRERYKRIHGFFNDKNMVRAYYRFEHDAAAGGLRMTCCAANAELVSAVLTLDPLDDGRDNPMGVADDVTLTVTNAVVKADGGRALECFVPYSDLKGFKAEPEAELPFMLKCNVVGKGRDGGDVPFALSLGRNGSMRLVLPAARKHE